MQTVLTYLIVILLIVLSGIFSGLTLGLMSLNKFELRRKVRMGNPDAKKIYPLRKKGNLLLTTLLLGNVAVNAILSIFLGSVTAGLKAFLIATGLIVIFGEVLPQSLFHAYALRLGAEFSWIVYVFMFLFYPVTKPLSMVLDKFIGREMPTIYSKKELHYLLEEHKDSKDSALDEDELHILQGGLKFSEKRVKDVMTPKENVFFIRLGTRIDHVVAAQIRSVGHSRMPVYDKSKDRVVGILYAKDLITLDPDHEVEVGHIMHKKFRAINENARLDQVLNMFRQARTHLFIVRFKKKLTGIITLEDVLEEIVGEIVDEYDSAVDMRRMKETLIKK